MILPPSGKSVPPFYFRVILAIVYHLIIKYLVARIHYLCMRVFFDHADAGVQISVSICLFLMSFVNESANDEFNGYA